MESVAWLSIRIGASIICLQSLDEDVFTFNLFCEGFFFIHFELPMQFSNAPINSIPVQHKNFHSR